MRLSPKALELIEFLSGEPSTLDWEQNGEFEGADYTLHLPSHSIVLTKGVDRYDHVTVTYGITIYDTTKGQQEYFYRVGDTEENRHRDFPSIAALYVSVVHNRNGRSASEAVLDNVMDQVKGRLNRA